VIIDKHKALMLLWNTLHLPIALSVLPPRPVLKKMH